MTESKNNIISGRVLLGEIANEIGEAFINNPQLKSAMIKHTEKVIQKAEEYGQYLRTEWQKAKEAGLMQHDENKDKEKWSWWTALSKDWQWGEGVYFADNESLGVQFYIKGKPKPDPLSYLSSMVWGSVGEDYNGLELLDYQFVLLAIIHDAQNWQAGRKRIYFNPLQEKTLSDRLCRAVWNHLESKIDSYNFRDVKNTIITALQTIKANLRQATKNSGDDNTIIPEPDSNSTSCSAIEMTIYGRFIKWCKNNRLICAILICFLIVVGVATFTDAIDKLVQFSHKYLYTPSPQSKPTTSYAPRPKPNVPIAPEIPLVDSKQHLPKEELRKDPEPLKTATATVDDKPVTVPKAARSASEIRQAVSAFGAALRGETTRNRVRSVAALLKSLPEDLNAREIALLAGSETTSHREQILELLVKRTKSRSLDPEDIPLVLGSETTSNRVKCIRIIAPYIRPPITGKQAVAILGSETYTHRVGCLRPIAPLLQRPLSKSEVTSILRSTSTSDRSEAIKILFGQAKNE